MRRGLVIAVLATVLAGAGYALAGAVSTGTVAVCVAAKVPAQTISANGNPIAVIPGKRSVDCRTVTYTVPTETSTTTETQTETTTLPAVTQTTTLPGTTVTTTLPAQTVTQTTTLPVTTTLPAQTVTTTQTVTQPVTTTVTQTVTVPGGSGSPGPFVASVWLGPNGSDTGPGCAFNATPVADPAASSCATPQKACQLADAQGNGFTIGVEPGYYANAGFVLNGCHDVTFRSEPGAFVSFEPNSSFSNTSNVTLQGDVKGHGVGFSLAYTAVPAGNTNLHWFAVNLYCETTTATGYIHLHSSSANEDACNDAININADGFQWIVGDQSDWAVCLTSCTHTGPQGNPNDDFINPAARNVLIEGVTQRNYFGMDPTGLHSEVWFLNGGDGVTFLDDQILDCAPPASTGYPVNTSCDTSLIFVGQLSGSTTTTNHLAIIGSVLDGGHPGQKSFQSGYDYPLGTEPTFTFANDSMGNSLTVCGVSAAPCGSGSNLSKLTGANMTFVGVVASLSSVGCFTAANYQHNVWYAATNNTTACGPTDRKFSYTPASTFFKAPGVPTFDYTPLAPLQASGEPAAQCAALLGPADLFGTATPTVTPCNVGAIQS